ncbi:MAG: sigma-70 family RNA polymerase sigma factor [Acidimicrobiales bacterium]
MDVDARVERVRVTYEAVHAPLWRAVLAYSGSADVADEAVAEAFAQLLRRGDGVDDPAAWAWRSAFRIAAGELKRRGGAPVPGVVPEVGVALPDPALDLLAALRHLTEQQRACVVLCDLAGHPAPEAARLLGTTPATVRVQRMRARRRLRDLLEDHDA